MIPFKGRPTKAAVPEDKPKNHVHAMPERPDFEIRFPVVENYVVALKQNLIKADIEKMEVLLLTPDKTPTAVFVKPQVGYQYGHPSLSGGFQTQIQDREEYYRRVHF